MKKTTKIILSLGIGLVAVGGIATGIYFLTKKKDMSDKNIGSGSGGGSTSTNNQGSVTTIPTTTPTTTQTPKAKDFSKLKDLAIIYPSPDGFRWQYIDMTVVNANKYVNYGGWYRTNITPHAFPSAITKKGRARYALDFCKGKNTCGNNRIANRYSKFVNHLKNQGINVVKVDDASKYQKYSKELLEKI